MLPKSLACALLAFGLALTPASAVADDDESSGSLPQQAIQAADKSLGPKAPVAVARAYDRGHSGLEILESLFEGAVREDGTIAADGKPLPPSRTPAGVVEGDATSAEGIALDALERGIQKTTRELDKKHDLAARAKRADVENEEAFTMLLVLAAMLQGYSPEQVIVDGLMSGGIRLTPAGLLIVDEKGKRIRPDALPDDMASADEEDAEPLLEAFVLDALDLVGGLDPRAAQTTPFKKQYEGTVKAVGFTGGDPLTLTAFFELGQPKNKKLREYLAGLGTGTLAGSGTCNVGGIAGTQASFRVDGPVTIGISGRDDDGMLHLRIAIPQANLSVTGDTSKLCVQTLASLSNVLESLTFPPVDVPARSGGSTSVKTTLGGEPIDLTVRIE